MNLTIFFSLALFLFSNVSFAATVDRIVAVVNNEVITSYDLDQATAAMGGEKSLRRRVLEELVKQKLLEQEMVKANVEVTAEELQRAIVGVLQKNGMEIEELRRELAGKGIAFESFKEQLAKQIQQAKFINQNLASQVQITQQDIQNYRKHNLGKDFNTRVRLGYVFLPLDAKSDAGDRSDLVRKGRKIAERGREGHFESLREEYSKKKEIETGDWNKELNELPSAIATVVRQMPLEGISDPIILPQGVYVLKLYEKVGRESASAENLSDDAIWQKLYNQRLEQEIDNYVNRLRRKAFVEIRE